MMKRPKTREQQRFEEDAEILAGTYASRLEAEAILEMKRKGMKRKDLAKAMHISQPNLVKILNSPNPKLTTIVKLAMALDADLALTWNGITIKADLLPDPEGEMAEVVVIDPQGFDADSLAPIAGK